MRATAAAAGVACGAAAAGGRAQGPQSPGRARAADRGLARPPTRPPPADWPGRKRKIATWIGVMWATGVGIPCFAVWWQQNKLKG
jgi:hypothetical protein